MFFLSHSLCVSFLSSIWVLAVPLSMSLITPHFYSRGQNLRYLLPLEDSVGEAKTLNKLFGGGGGKFTYDFNEDGKQCFFLDFMCLAIILRKRTFLLFSYWIFFHRNQQPKGCTYVLFYCIPIHTSSASFCPLKTYFVISHRDLLAIHCITWHCI